MRKQTIGVDLNEKLLLACKGLDVNLVHSLLKQGADANSPLLSAIQSGLDNYEIIHLLLRHGAQPNSKSIRQPGSYSQSVFQHILPHLLETNNGRLLSLFLTFGADPNTIIVERGASLLVDKYSVEYPLHVAVTKGCVEGVRLLLASGAKVNALRVQRDGPFSDCVETALHMIARQKENTKTLEIAYQLMKHGANVNMQCRSNGQRADGTAITQTPLHTAILNYNPGIMSLLVASGANIQEFFNTGNTNYTVFQLCKGNPVLLSALVCWWTPQGHKYFQKPVKDAIMSILIIAKRNNWQWGTHVFHLIFSFMAYNWAR